MMNNWFIFQLALDAVLLIAVALLALREGKPDTENPPPPAPPLNLVEIEVLAEELAKLVARAERAADRIEKGISATGLEPPSSAVENKTIQKPDTLNVSPDSGSVLDDDTYLKAARLIKKGLPDEEVGRKVGLPPHEVKLIRKMMT